MVSNKVLNVLFLLIASIVISFISLAQTDLAEPIFSPAAEEFPQYPSSTVLYNQYVESGNHYLSLSLYKEAKDAFWKAIHLYPDNPDAYVNLGIVHMTEGDLDSAERILRQAEGLAGSSYKQAEILFYNLGMCSFLREDYSQAVLYFQRALANYSGFAQARYYLGLSYHNLGQREEAFTNIFMASYLFEQNNDSKASLEARQLLRNIGGRESVDRFSLANKLLESGRGAVNRQELDKAIVLFEESVFLNPNNVEAYYELSLIYSQKKAFHNAIKYLNKAIEVDPSFIKAYLGLNQAYRQVEKYDLAVEILEAASNIEANNPNIAYHIGMAYLEKQEFNTARRYLAKAELDALASKDMVLVERIRSAYDLIGQHKEAKTKPPYFPKKIQRKTTQHPYPYYPVSGNGGYLNKGFFIPHPDYLDKNKETRSSTSLLEY